jgi:uncharacterized FlaG/YvyC family protein
MRIAAEQSQTAPIEPPNASANQAKAERSSTQSSTASAVESAATAAGTPVVTPTQRQTDVTLRQDTSGQIYYVVTDANSGEEILEVPPKEVRDVGEGIEDYLKQEESKAATRVQVKA